MNNPVKQNGFVFFSNTPILIEAGDSIGIGSPYRQLTDFLMDAFNLPLTVTIVHDSIKSAEEFFAQPQLRESDYLVSRQNRAIILAKIERNDQDVISEQRKANEDQSYVIHISEHRILIESFSQLGQYYGVCTLIDLIKKEGLILTNRIINETPTFTHRGVLLDVTRGRVPKLDYLKEIIDMLAQAKINQIQLYMEHTYRFPFMTEVSMGKDGFTLLELKLLDDYCFERHIELIPCIATFGHLYEVLSSVSYRDLCEYEAFSEPYSWMNRQVHHTIDCKNPKSLDLIRHMIEEIAHCFRSSYINICGDETYDMGRGRNKEYLKRDGNERMYVDFLNRIFEITFENGKIPMFWGDIILQYPNFIQEVNELAIPLHWWYESEVNEHEFNLLNKNGRPFYTCPGTAGWNHFMNDYKRAYTNINFMLEYGAKHGSVGALITDWGDFGHINTYATSLPLLMYGAAKAWDSTYNKDSLQDFVGGIIPNYYERIGLERLVTWETLMKWYYALRYKDYSYGKPSETFEDIDPREVEKSITTLKLLEIEGVSYLNRLTSNQQKDMQEVMHQSKGILWMLEFVKVIQSNVYENFQANDHSKLLAADIETWFMEYEALWRTRYRESELYRIREVIVDLCRYLRIGKITT